MAGLSLERSPIARKKPKLRLRRIGNADAVKKTLSRRFSASSSSSSTRQAVTPSMNVLQWLETAAVEDVLPKILACLGPQQTAALSSVNRHWRAIVGKESTWKVMCQDLYKWKEGDDEPSSWLEYYCANPCIPIDYRTVDAALAQPRHGPTTVWVRPGTHVMQNSLVVDANLVIRGMQLPKNVYRPPLRAPTLSESSTESLPELKRGRSLRKFLRRHREPYDAERSDSSLESITIEPASSLRPLLVFRSRRANEPLLWVRHGQVAMEGVDLDHRCPGLDIWSGNAVIQVQPSRGMLPTLKMVGCKVRSRSGRGIVCMDGGQLSLESSAVIDCAATGVYIGGPGSSAVLQDSDIIGNGIGSSHRRGIARGHSGIYLEQGHCRITSCNVSSNTLTGISAVSPTAAILTLMDSDLTANGTFQVELPAPHSDARRRAVLSGNNHGASQARMRSGLVEERSAEEEPVMVLTVR